MRFKHLAAAFVFAGAFGLLAAPASAQSAHRGYSGRGNTVFTNRDEDGRTRTRVIIQKRSYLDPGTESFPGERSDTGYAWEPTDHASSVLDNTVFGGNDTPLPGPFTLPGKNNPWIGY
jgi:hypothetical protein